MHLNLRTTWMLVVGGLGLFVGCSTGEGQPLITGEAVTLADPDSTPFWPAFQGPRGDNIADETGLLREWPADGPPLLWKAEGIGQGFSSVSLARGLIYTAGSIGEQTVVTAVDLDGKIRWQMPVGGAWTGSHPGSRSTPTIDGDFIYFQNPLGELFCLQAATGKVVWNVNVLERFGASNITWALAESIVIDGNHVISTPGGPQTAVVALDKKTGETVWQSPSADGDPTGYATPTLVEYQGKRLILTCTGKAVICVDADNGKLCWRFPHETSYDVNALKPIFHDGRVFMSSGYGAGSRMLKLEVSGDEVKVSELWTNKDLDNHHGGVLLWDGYLYGSKYSRGWTCLDWANGQTAYTKPGVGKGSLTCADGLLYTLSEKLDMGLVAASGEQFDVISQFELPSDGEGPSWAYPVVCGGKLYVRHDNTLFCYDVTAKK